MANKKIYYAGIGSRETPDFVLDIMVECGKYFAEKGYVLRSGGADGADSAFESGCDMANGKKEIFLPWFNFNQNESSLSVPDFHNYNQAERIAAEFHPNWDNLSQGAQKLHTRNVYQVLGKNLKTPVAFVICYARVVRGVPQGGTAQAIRIAESRGVKIINVYFEKILKQVKKVLDSRNNLGILQDYGN